MTASSTDASLRSDATVTLDDIKRLISLFSEGIGGQTLTIHSFDTATDESNRPRRQGISSDGQSIHLPASLSIHDSAGANFGAYRVSVLHQVGYDEFGTFRFNLANAAQIDPQIKAKLDAAAPELDTAPVSIEPPKRLDLERFFSLWPEPEMVKGLFQTIEAWRVDRAIAHHYPGAVADLTREMNHALATRTATPGHPLGQVHERITRYTLGDTLAFASDGDLALSSVKAALDTMPMHDHSVYDSARITARITDWIATEYFSVQSGEIIDAEQLSEMASADDASADDHPNQGKPVQYRGEPFAMPAMVKRREQAADIADPELTNYVDAESSDADEDDEEKPNNALLESLTPRPAAPKDNELHIKVNEWDYLKQRYKRDWCTIVQYPLGGEAGTFHRDLMTRHRDVFARTKRQFNSIRPEAIRRERRQPDGEEFELDRLIERIADRRAGLTGDDRLYMQRQRAERDVSAAFLLDMSASTDFPVPDATIPETNSNQGTTDDPADEFGWAPNLTVGQIKPHPTPPPKRRVIDVARESLALMSSALETLGDRYAIFGFSGQGRHWVSFGVAKQFNERCSARTWGALAAIGPQGSTRMGAAVRHTIAKLKDERAKLKVLIIVSDGYPQDMDYGPDRGNDEYGLQDTAKALTEAKQLGIETFCVTVDPAGNDYLRRMCPDQRYLVIDEVNALPVELSKVYRALTTRAS